MNPENHCPTCGASIPADTDGLCVRCLGQLGFFSEASGARGENRLRLGNYELLEEIARGGMGVVYRARQASLNRIVALKVVLHGPFSCPDSLRRFQNEAQAIAALRHPNIVAIHEIGEHNGSHFISLEYVEGRSFAELARDHPLPATQAAGYLKTIAEAVEHAHQRGVLHRDLKPSNILLDIFDQPRLTDFGLAKLPDQEGGLTVTGQVLGSPNYMPPEQAIGKYSDATACSDVYSLGAILYELLTGRPPFQAENLQAILTQVQMAEPVPPQRLNPDTPVDLQTICLKCLQKEPVRRYASAQQLADDLGRFLDHQPIHARPVSPLERAWLWRRRRPWLAAFIASFIAVIILCATGVLVEWRRAERLRLVAEQDAAETRLNLYAADVAVASQAVQSGNFGLARRTLKQLRPKPGETDLRGFEWRYLQQSSRGDQLATLTGHTRTVTCVAFSPDGHLLATGSQDGSVRIWDSSRKEARQVFKLSSNALWSVRFTPDGKNLLASHDQQTTFWDTTTWQRGKDFPGDLAALSKSGDVLATAESSPFFWEPAGLVRLFNWRTGQQLGQLERPGRTLALSPDGRQLAVAGVHDGITLWDTGTQKLLQDWPTQNPVWSLDFSPDGRRLLSAGWSSEVALWQADSQAPPRIFPNGQLNVWSAVFSDDGATLATTSSDQTIRLWNAATLTLKATLRGHDSEVWCARFSPDGKWIASGGKDQNVMLWTSGLERPQMELPGDRNVRPVFSHNGNWLAAVNPNTGHSMLWKVNPALEPAGVADGVIAGFAADDTPVIFNAEHRELKLMTGGVDLRNTTALESFQAAKKTVFDGLSPDGKCFFAIAADGQIQLWNVETGRRLGTFSGPRPAIRNAVLSPGGKYLAVCVEVDAVVHLFDCGHSAERKLSGHTDFVSGLAFSPDGTTLATGSMDGTIRLWDSASGTAVATLAGHMEEATDVAFSPDGRTLASLGQRESLKLWHLPTRREVVSEFLTNAGLWVQFSPDSRHLAVSLAPNQIRLLDASEK